MYLSRRTLLTWILCARATPALARRPLSPVDGPSEVEWQIGFLTNQQRLWKKLAPLAWSEELVQAARAHSADMLARRFFDHRNPDGLGPDGRVARLGLQWSVAENLYSIKYGPEDAAHVASIVVRGWMDTRGHRRNILDARFRHIGVGTAGDARGLMVTELFGG